MAERKTLTFACIHFTVAFGVGWAVTGSPVIGGVLAVVEPLVNTVAFYLHERVWQRLAQSRGQEARGESMQAFVETLDLPDDAKSRLRALTPGTYTGLAESLARGV